MTFTRKYKMMIAGCCLLCSTSLFAQNIELPDVTTVITGDTVKAGVDALPSFTDVIVIPETSGQVVPELPDVDAPATSEISTNGKADAEKAIYAEGLIGGGYPTLFVGNFSVFRVSGLSPFKLYFEHDSANGYSGHSLSDGYKDTTTKLEVEKSFQKNQLNWGFAGSYNAVSNGLQNHIPGITGLNQDNYNGSGNISYELKNGFSVGANGGLNFYNRYADISNGEFPIANVINLTPELFINWEGYGFNAGLSAEYTFENDLEDTVSEDVLHRALFDAKVQWSNEVIQAFGNVGLVVGNKLNDNKVIPPFTVGIVADIPVYFSNRRLSIGAKGGLDSKLNTVSELETKNKFSGLTFMPEETADWYGRLDLSIPVKESFTGALALEYRQSAFDTGYYQPLYSEGNNPPFFAYGYSELQQLNSEITLTYHYKIFSISGGWKSYWIDVPELESAHLLTLDVNFQSEDSKWGVNMNTKMQLESELIVPEVNLEAFVRITPAVRAIASVEDTLKLLKAETRTYAGDYITRSGSAAVMLKFFF